MSYFMLYSYCRAISNVLHDQPVVADCRIFLVFHVWKQGDSKRSCIVFCGLIRCGYDWHTAANTICHNLITHSNTIIHVLRRWSRLKARLHSKSRHACLRHEHLGHACLGCLHINVFVHVSSISRHLPLTICKQRLKSNNGEWWYCCYFAHYTCNHCKCS